MSIKDFLLIIISRIVAGIGMPLGLISTVYTIWSFFFSQNPYCFVLGIGGIVVFFIGYGIYKFALAKIYDESDHYK